MQLNGPIKRREDSGAKMQLIQVIFRYLSWVQTQSTALRYWTSVISSLINWNTCTSWFHWPRTSHQMQFSQLPNQHGTTWAVTSTAQWADCFWERVIFLTFPWPFYNLVDTGYVVVACDGLCWLLKSTGLVETQVRSRNVPTMERSPFEEPVSGSP